MFYILILKMARGTDQKPRGPGTIVNMKGTEQTHHISLVSGVKKDISFRPRQ